MIRSTYNRHMHISQTNKDQTQLAATTKTSQSQTQTEPRAEHDKQIERFQSIPDYSKFKSLEEVLFNQYQMRVISFNLK